MIIGVLALQGAFREHIQRLQELGVEAREVRLAKDLEGLQGLIMPGGESTTMVNLITVYELWEPIRRFYEQGGALWGTCAGAILLASEVDGYSPNLGKQLSLKLLDMTVKRNAFGRQVDSFTVPLVIQGLEQAFPAVFIRAPVMSQVGPQVEVLAQHEGQNVLVKQGRVLASSFHPELTKDTRLHQLFLEMIEEQE